MTWILCPQARLAPGFVPLPRSAAKYQVLLGPRPHNGRRGHKKHFLVDLFPRLWYVLDMPSLTPKLIDGHTYYYARYCQRVDGKPKIVRTVYLGKIEDLVAAAEGARQVPQPLETEVAAFGDVPEGGYIAAGGHFGLQRLGRLAGALGGRDQVLDLAEVDGADDLGFAVHALAVAGVVVGVAVDELGRETRYI